MKAVLSTLAFDDLYTYQLVHLIPCETNYVLSLKDNERHVQLKDDHKLGLVS